MKKYFLYFIIISGILILVFFFAHTNPVKKNINVLKSVIIAPVVTPAKSFTILIVPGHDTDTGGASFKNIYERNLVVDVADNISTLLNKDSKYKVIVARNKQVWNPIFANYFIDKERAILDFKNQHQVFNKLLIASGQKKAISDSATHSIVDQKTAIELYGINKWADVNNVDLIIHLHFNSSSRKNMNLPGTYHGFDMFIPESQRVNSVTSRVIAEDIYKELQKKFTPESNSKHNSLFEDQSLIALGASDTLTKPAILIEYGYIYEKMLQSTITREKALEQMAEQTVAGIQDYFH